MKKTYDEFTDAFGKKSDVWMGNSYIFFQCTDIYNHALICGAYDRVDLNDLRFNDWHNY